MKQPSTITWPAVIKFEGDDEMLYVSSQSAWYADKDLYACSYEAGDVLIDASGKMFSLSGQVDKPVVPQDLGKSIALSGLVELVRKHASSIGECCSSKMYFSSVSEAISAINDLAD